MEQERGKRVPEEVLFKWDNDHDSKRRPFADAEGAAAAGSGSDPLSSAGVGAFRNVLPTRVVPSAQADANNVHLEAKRLRETVANVQLSHNRDWLAANTRVTALAKLDVLDRLSCMLFNRDSAMRYESLRYLQRECTSEFEFGKKLCELRLRRLNSTVVPEYCIPPVHIRNTTLVSKMKGKCGCPLQVYIHWDMRSPAPGAVKGAAAVPNSALTGIRIGGSAAVRPSLNFAGDAFLTAREEPMGTGPQGGSTRFDRVLGGLFNGTTYYDANTDVHVAGEAAPQAVAPPVQAAPEQRAAPSTDPTGSWALSSNDFRPSSQVSGNVSAAAATGAANDGRYTREHLEAVCPMHAAFALPDLLCSKGGSMKVIRDLGLVCRYEVSSANAGEVHILSLHKMLGDTKVFNFRLPSALQTTNAVYLRDFELERYQSAFSPEVRASDEVDKLRHSYLSSVYTGPALLIVTSSEFIIALVHETAGSLRLGVLFRERNCGHVINEVYGHRASGRVFMLGPNSLLYEFQYQLGAIDVRDTSMLGKMMPMIVKGCKFVLTALTNERVYKLRGTVPGGYAVELGAGATHSRVADPDNWWEGSGNCLADLGKPCPVSGTVYWPPLQWRELHLSLQESSFADGFSRDSCTCVSRSCCVKHECRTCVKLLNPWDKAYFGVFASGASTLSLDEDRWLLCMLREDSGDLSVFKIPDECNFEHFIKGVVDYDRMFPYTLTYYSLRNSDLVSQLMRAGYFRMVGNPAGYRCCAVLPVPLGLCDGVDIVLVDNYGSRIFVGFATDQNKKTSLVVKGFKAVQMLIERRPVPSRPTSIATGWQAAAQPQAANTTAVQVKRSYYYVSDLFVVCESYVKTNNMTFAKVTLFAPETASLCQSSGPSPQSVSEELWSHNQRQSTPRGDSGAYNSAAPSLRPIEWYDEFCILLSPGETILDVFSQRRDSADGKPGFSWQLVFVTSQKVYTLYRSSLMRLISALLEHPLSTLRYLDPPMMAHDHRNAIASQRFNKANEALEASHFVDIFADGPQHGDLCGEDAAKEAVAYGLYYLAWLFTPEEVFRTCWELLSDRSEPMLESLLLGANDAQGLLLTSLGISSQAFGWTAPGAYAVDDTGKPTTPAVSPWCKFVIFSEPKLHRFNRVCTGMTSVAVDGVLSLVCGLLESVWLERTFCCVPLLTSDRRASSNESSLPFTPHDQLKHRNEFVVGSRFESDLMLCLRRPFAEVKARLVQMRNLYLLLCKVAMQYEAMQPGTVEAVATSVSRLSLSLQRDIFPDDCPAEQSFAGDAFKNPVASGFGTDSVGNAGHSVPHVGVTAELASAEKAPPFDVATILRRLRQRRENDMKTLRELVMLLEITQEYLACCLLLHRNCILGDVQHEFGRMFADVRLLPSQGHGRMSMYDLSYSPVMQPHEPTVTPFSVERVAAADRPPYAFTMSREFFFIVSRSNLLNLCSNQEYYRSFRVAVWMAGGEVSNLQDYFYGHLFKSDELRLKHWSSMVKALERQLATADSDASVAQYARMLMRYLGERQAAQ
ncbi:hypothetical protein, conserved [Babesia bigemina]|uniref:Uncharacterized protein n=1 Tax=Babesia bigemina TaxID=5866 RepID=A0A061DDN4_BABBI|nr:hypothetical protein, conserved [Babesia bigemina]CDR96410.1 hypothetical protein, conserved [Babesia bigemina]|eukprot:XP_012768596.1 hypothetical protein, conserved [Babesia bigemina]